MRSSRLIGGVDPACYGSLLVTADLLATYDWAGTSLGPVSTWPKSLVGYVKMIMEMPSPAIIFWGPEQTQIYNAGYAVIMGPRHPRYFAGSYRECWPETYPIIYPWMQQVLAGGTWEVKDTSIMMTRHGFNEEAFFTFTFSPLRDDTGAIAGIYQPVLEVTAAVLAARRAETVRALAPRADSLRELTEAAVTALEANPKCVPFSLVYLDTTIDVAVVARTGIEASADVTGFHAIAREVLATGIPRKIDNVGDVLGWTHHGAWPEPTQLAYAVAIRRSPAERIHGVAIFGISPRLVFDETYAAFFNAMARELGANVAAHVATQAIATALQREQLGRARAEAEVALRTDAEIALRTSEERLRRVIEVSNVGTWELGTDDVLRMDTRLCELFGVAKGAPYDLEAILAGIHPEDRAMVEHAIGSARAGENNGHYHAEFRTVGTGDGRWRWLESRGQRYVDGDGIPLRLIGVAVEITERKEAEAERARLLETAEGARAEAEGANRAKDEFLAILGHELRNPLAPILTALHLLHERGGPETVREHNVIERQARHLLRLVDDLLDVSRITRGMVTLQTEQVEVLDIVTAAIETVHPMIEQRRHQLLLEVPRGLVLDADVSRMTQVLSNLLTNAAKYSAVGSPIGIRASRTGDGIELSVRDHGIGIAEDMLPRVFEMFTQERQALDRSSGGLGLGLTIVRSLVELHRGTVKARSEGHKLGSEFVISLPAAMTSAPRTSAEVRAADAPEPATVQRRVLIVDDNEDAAELLGEALSDLGYTVRVVHDGASALSIFDEYAPSIALLDIGLPVMDGYEVSRRLRERHAPDKLRLIAVTGYGQPSDRERSRIAGFDEHLVKPVSVREVHAVLSKLS
ncbi:MAG: hypothetical protein JWP01_1472 [Myxococcales bacterium]|nr:hypothetical protein [Myxococcales bacterium]